MKKIIGLYTIFTALLMVSCHDDSDDNNKNSGTTPTEAIVDQDDDSGTISDSYTFTLPVIFHVLYSNRNDTTQYISASRLATVLSRVNELYQGGIYGTSSNVKVKFVLAERDESDQKLSTPGVEYIRWTGEYPIDVTAFMKSSDNVKYIWDPNEYINVMIYHFKSDDGSAKSSTLGISHLPLMPQLTDSLQGLSVVPYTSLKKANLSYPLCSSINSDYMFNESTRYTLANKAAQSYLFSSVDVNVTMAHELGHYLGLHHVFTEKDGETADYCEDTDYCDDTPSYNRVEYTEELTAYLKTVKGDNYDFNKLLQRQPCSGTGYKAYNMMDYDITLGYQFSDDQVARMRKVLTYALLMPGPKLKASDATKATRSSEGVLDLPMMIRK